MAEVLRQLSMTYKQIVAIVDVDLLPYLEDSWKYLPKEMRAIERLIDVNKTINGIRPP